jgi:hypothetical protein
VLKKNNKNVATISEDMSKNDNFFPSFPKKSENGDLGKKKVKKREEYSYFPQLISGFMVVTYCVRSRCYV